MADHVTKSEFARRLGVSPARVSQLVALGLPVSPETGRIPVEDGLVWVRENVDRDRAGNQDHADTLMAARIRATNALADLREHDLAVRRGRYVSRAAVEDALAEVAERYAGQLRLALGVTHDDAFAALVGIGVRIAAEARLGGLMELEIEDDADE